MSRTRAAQSPIYSSLAADPRLAELIAQFVCELPARAARLKRHLASQDWQSLYRTVHQLKGAAGTYGFETLAPYALRVEHHIVEGAEPRVIAASVHKLIAHSNRVAAGSPQTSVAD